LLAENPSNVPFILSFAARYLCYAQKLAEVLAQRLDLFSALAILGIAGVAYVCLGIIHQWHRLPLS
jgi:hypothetical protein